MRKLSKRSRDVIDTDDYYRRCARQDEGGCMGRITIEHALIFGGRQVDEPFALVPLCARHHAVDEFQDGGALDKGKNIWIALNRATDTELKTISKAVDYLGMRKYLNSKYGIYTPTRA